MLQGVEKNIPIHVDRKRVYDRFYDFLANDPRVKNERYLEDDLKRLAINFERGIFNSALRLYSIKNHNETWNDVFRNIYMSRAVTVYNNIKPNTRLNNGTLLSRLIAGELDEFSICYMTPEQLDPENWALLEQRVAEKKTMPVLERPDGLFKCGRCKSYKTEYNERQTRSADEPTTKFCYCHNCGNRWRFC